MLRRVNIIYLRTESKCCNRAAMIERTESEKEIVTKVQIALLKMKYSIALSALHHYARCVDTEDPVCVVAKGALAKIRKAEAYSHLVFKDQKVH